MRRWRWRDVIDGKWENFVWQIGNQLESDWQSWKTVLIPADHFSIPATIRIESRQQSSRRY